MQSSSSETMKTKKIAQASVEYLLVFGFAVISTIILVVLSWQSGVFYQPISTNTRIEGFSQIIIEDFSVNENFVNMSLKNDAPDILQIRKINLTFDYSYQCIYEIPIEITPSSSTTLTINCNLNEKYQRGSSYRANIDIIYINIRTNSFHSSEGIVFGNVK